MYMYFLQEGGVVGAGGRGGEEERRGSGGGQGDSRWQTAGYWQWLENMGMSGELPLVSYKGKYTLT